MDVDDPRFSVGVDSLVREIRGRHDSVVAIEKAAGVGAAPVPFTLERC